MAQRFAIDGNFTQSFVGTVKLNASACGTSDLENFASLYYDLTNGSVCYTTASQDFCYEFIFDSETTIVSGKSGDDVITKAYAQVGKFQFVGISGGEGPVGTISYPKTNLDNTLYLLFNSESANGVNLYNYLLQNSSSGSLTLSTTTQEVQFNYYTQIVDDNQIVIGSNTFTASLDSSSLTVLTQTSTTPFINGERVCVSVSSQGGGTATTYQTGSDEAFTSLNNLKIIDYDSNVFVTSDPITGQLTLQFGSPALPSITSFNIPTTTAQNTSAFDTNRFSGPDTVTGKSGYVVDGEYTAYFQYTTASSNTFLSTSLEGFYDGDYEEIATSTDSDGYVAFTIDSGIGSPYFDYFKSGSSHKFRAKLHVLLEDGSSFTTASSPVTVSLSKNPPEDPGIITSWDINFPSYATNTGATSYAQSKIEKGVTGSIDWSSAANASSDGWDLVGVNPTIISPSTRTISETITPASLPLTASWTSSGLGTPDTIDTTNEKTFSRIVSLRYAALPAGTFANNLAPTEAELLNLQTWIDEGGTIDFTTVNPAGQNFEVSWTGDKYIYIIMNTSYTLTQINIGILNQIGQFTTGTTTSYRYYVTSDIQADNASPFDITLETT